MFKIPSVIVMFIAPLQLVLLLSPLALAALVKRAPHDSNENLIWTGGAGEAKFGERPHVCAILKWEMVPKVNGFRSELEPRFKFSSRNL